MGRRTATRNFFPPKPNAAFPFDTEKRPRDQAGLIFCDLGADAFLCFASEQELAAASPLLRPPRLPVSRSSSAMGSVVGDLEHDQCLIVHSG